MRPKSRVSFRKKNCFWPKCVKTVNLMQKYSVVKVEDEKLTVHDGTTYVSVSSPIISSVIEM